MNVQTTSRIPSLPSLPDELWLEVATFAADSHANLRRFRNLCHRSLTLLQTSQAYVALTQVLPSWTRQDLEAWVRQEFFSSSSAPQLLNILLARTQDANPTIRHRCLFALISLLNDLPAKGKELPFLLNSTHPLLQQVLPLRNLPENPILSRLTPLKPLPELHQLLAQDEKHGYIETLMHEDTQSLWLAILDLSNSDLQSSAIALSSKIMAFYGLEHFALNFFKELIALLYHREPDDDHSVSDAACKHALHHLLHADTSSLNLEAGPATWVVENELRLIDDCFERVNENVVYIDLRNEKSVRIQGFRPTPNFVTLGWDSIEDTMTHSELNTLQLWAYQARLFDNITDILSFAHRTGNTPEYEQTIERWAEIFSKIIYRADAWQNWAEICLSEYAGLYTFTCLWDKNAPARARDFLTLLTEDEDVFPESFHILVNYLSRTLCPENPDLFFLPRNFPAQLKALLANTKVPQPQQEKLLQHFQTLGLA